MSDSETLIEEARSEPKIAERIDWLDWITKMSRGEGISLGELVCLLNEIPPPAEIDAAFGGLPSDVKTALVVGKKRAIALQALYNKIREESKSGEILAIGRYRSHRGENLPVVVPPGARGLKKLDIAIPQPMYDAWATLPLTDDDCRETIEGTEYIPIIWLAYMLDELTRPQGTRFVMIHEHLEEGKPSAEPISKTVKAVYQKLKDAYEQGEAAIFMDYPDAREALSGNSQCLCIKTEEIKRVCEEVINTSLPERYLWQKEFIDERKSHMERTERDWVFSVNEQIRLYEQNQGRCELLKMINESFSSEEQPAPSLNQKTYLSRFETLNLADLLLQIYTDSAEFDLALNEADNSSYDKWLWESRNGMGGNDVPDNRLHTVLPYYKTLQFQIEKDIREGKLPAHYADVVEWGKIYKFPVKEGIAYLQAAGVSIPDWALEFVNSPKGQAIEGRPGTVEKTDQERRAEFYQDAYEQWSELPGGSKSRKLELFHKKKERTLPEVMKGMKKSALSTGFNRHVSGNNLPPVE